MTDDKAFELVREGLWTDRALQIHWPSCPFHAAAEIAARLGKLNEALIDGGHERRLVEAKHLASVALRFLINIDHYDLRQCNRVFDPNDTDGILPANEEAA